MLQIR